MIPALAPHEATVAQVLKVVGDVDGIMGTGSRVTFQGAAVLRLMANNKAWAPLSEKLLGTAPGLLQNLTLKQRSATAPGTFLGTLTRKLFMKSALYRDYVAWLPEYTETDRVDKAVGVGRALAGARVNRFIDFTFGNNELARLLGGTTHAGVDVAASSQANLFKVWAATGESAKLAQAAAVLKTDPTKLTRMGALARTAGAARTFGVVSQVGLTAYSAANVISQGNPVDAFKRNGAGYVADVAELGFNASLTAAMIAPNPFTIGATVVFGGVYLGAKVVEHWDDIKEGAGKAAKKVGGFVKKLNPFG